MILMYHKIGPETPTMWWVSVDAFYRQMCDLTAYDVVHLDDYDPLNPRHVAITFDGVYVNVLQFAAPILRQFSYPFDLFLSGDHVGQSNEFDAVEPPAQFCDPEQLRSLIGFGGRLQWHSASHVDLRSLTSENDRERELAVPSALRALDPSGFRWFAYPHGEYDDASLALVRRSFTGGLSCHQGDDRDRHRLNRVTVTEESRFRRTSTSLIIPCYNYGHLLPEAVDSALAQTYPADEILIVDDHSTDNTELVGHALARSHGKLVSFHRNSENLGIIRCFNEAVRRTSGDYICILGADNRLRSDYLEKTVAALNRHPQAAVAYTDFALFGPRAAIVYEGFPAEQRGPVLEQRVFLIRFPDPDSETFAAGFESGTNYLHGSSLYRREAFEKVGGYQQADDPARPEDYHLFSRMLSVGWQGVRIDEPLLEYRQHSAEQANSVVTLQAKVSFYEQKCAELLAGLEAIEAERLKAAEFIEARAQDVASSHRKIAELDEAIRAKNDWIAKLEASCKAKDAWAEKLQESCQAKDDWIAKLERDIAQFAPSRRDST